jgi:hypothetical protein
MTERMSRWRDRQIYMIKRGRKRRHKKDLNDFNTFPHYLVISPALLRISKGVFKHIYFFYYISDNFNKIASLVISKILKIY